MNADDIDRILPQTQCRQCGFDGCRPYAQAIVRGEAGIGLCAPGGEEVMRDIARITGKPAETPIHTSPALAWIIEEECIGCTACIRACPVDAIIGASRQMHSVLADECTGCGLCVEPCPVDCIEMRPMMTDYLPRNRWFGGETPRFQAAAHARKRYEEHTHRLERQAEEKRTRHAVRVPLSGSPRPPTNDFSALIARAQARAQANSERRVSAANQADFERRQLEKAQKQAEYRRAMRDLQYGDGETRAAARAWLAANPQTER